MTLKKITLLAAVLMIAPCGPARADKAVSARITGALESPASPAEEKFIQRRLSPPAESPTPEKPAVPPAAAPGGGRAAPPAESRPAPPDNPPRPAPVEKSLPEPEAPPSARGPVRPGAAKIEYYTRLRDLMMANWPSPDRQTWPGAAPKTLLCVIIEPDGRVEHHRLMESSGYDDYDQLVLKTLKTSLPFPPLPPVFGGRPDRPCFIFDLDEIERLKAGRGR